MKTHKMSRKFLIFKFAAYFLVISFSLFASLSCFFGILVTQNIDSNFDSIQSEVLGDNQFVTQLNGDVQVSPKILLINNSNNQSVVRHSQPDDASRDVSKSESDVKSDPHVTDSLLKKRRPRASSASAEAAALSGHQDHDRDEESSKSGYLYHNQPPPAVPPQGPQPGQSGGSSQTMPRVVTTKYGAIRGFIISNRKEAPISSSRPGSSRPSSPPNSQDSFATISALPEVETFLGVPYASPPVGSLRFMPPVTPTHWRGVRSATRHGPVCPQPLPTLLAASAAINPGASPTGSARQPAGPSSASSDMLLKNMPAARAEHLRRLSSFLRNQSEDCLYLNLYVSLGHTSGDGSSASSSSDSTYESKGNIFMTL